MLVLYADIHPYLHPRRKTENNYMVLLIQEVSTNIGIKGNIIINKFSSLHTCGFCAFISSFLQPILLKKTSEQNYDQK